MDKYRGQAEKKLTNKIHPDMLAKEALSDASFASQEREFFFDKVYGQLLVDYFINWLKTEPHETKTREFIYNSALALGDVKSRLISMETYGKNISIIDKQEDKNENN